MRIGYKFIAEKLSPSTLIALLCVTDYFRSVDLETTLVICNSDYLKISCDFDLQTSHICEVACVLGDEFFIREGEGYLYIFCSDPDYPGDGVDVIINDTNKLKAA
jgi:hypothetical protein